MHRVRIGMFAILGLTVGTAVTAAAQQGVQDGQWPNYSGDKGSTKYAALDQIDASNVKDLNIVWRWASPDNSIVQENPAKVPGRFKVTPLFVNGVMYTATTFNMAAAIDPKTGDTLWTFDPEVWKGRRPGNLGFNARGLAYWEDSDGNGRIILCTQHNYMYALDPKTGELIEEFGDGGIVDLNAPYRRPVNRAYVWAISPALVVGDVIVVGRAINDGPTVKEMPPGDVFGFDVRSGAHLWTFHNPPEEGEPGHDTWKEGSAAYTGNSNVWTHMSADPELGLVYLPFGTPTNDWYGGHRKGLNKWAESIVCVEAKTGKFVWGFQHVHHGLWDYDIPTAPALMDITVDGRDIKALAQITKQGFCWVLDRTSGKPVWPIEERPVPQSTVPGEETSPTQPFPTKPAPYDQQGSMAENLIDYTPELKAEALEILSQYNHGPLYTPPVLDRPTINNPGWGGGGNWSGVSYDPERFILYIPSVSGAAMTLSLSEPDPARSNFRYIGRPGFGLRGPQGLPLFKGPYSRVTAIDMTTGDHLWQVPIGDGPTDHPLLKPLKLGPLGGRSAGHPVLTKTLLFLTTSGGGPRGQGDGDTGESDPNFWVIDKATGEVVHSISLPGSPSGTPMTYLLDGKQYITVAVGGGRDPAELITLGLQ